jgi:hypothetical protein
MARSRPPSPRRVGSSGPRKSGGESEMGKLPVQITEYPEQLTQSGRYTIESVKPPQETRFGSAVILLVANPKGEERSLFVPYSPEVSSRTNLARLMQAFGDDTDHWVTRKIDVTIGKDGKRTVEPVVK